LSRLLLVSLASAGLTWWLLALTLPVLRRRLLDQPNQRSAHQEPTPRGGGFAFVLIGSVSPLLLGVVDSTGLGVSSARLLPLLCTPLAFVGLVDDRHNLSASLRYGIQVATALALIGLIRPWLFTSGGSAWISVLAVPLLAVAVTAVINFVNFMDGLDGLVTTCMALMLTVASVQLSTTAFLPLVGALLGFLVWNWSPARVFMGDVGSTFLGALFAGAVLSEPRPDEALGLLLVGFPLLGDAFLCVLARFLAGQPIFHAHRLHLFQRLYQAGWSHARVASLYGFATLISGLALLEFGTLGVGMVAALELAIGIWLHIRVAVPFLVEPLNKC